MKKLVIITTVPLTIRAFLMEQLEFLSEQYDIWVISSGEFPDIEKLKKISVNYINVDMKRRVSPFSDVLSIIRLRKILKDINPDIVHSFTPKAGLIGMIASFFARLQNRVHSFTGLLFPTKKGWRKQIFRLVDILICYCATNPLAEGAGVKRDLLEGNITQKHLEIIGSGNIAGVNVAYFSKQQFLIDVGNGTSKSIYNKTTPDELVFSYAGRFTKDKGLIELLDAFEEMPNNCRLLLAGAQDERAPLCSSVISRIKVNPHIINFGWLEDIRGLLYASDVFVLPSYREGFPNTPLQASSMEVPSIVTDINGSNEIIRDSLNGYVVLPQSKNSLLSGMMKAYENKQNLPKLGAQARQVVLQKFDRTKHHQNILSFYKRISP